MASPSKRGGNDPSTDTATAPGAGAGSDENARWLDQGGDPACWAGLLCPECGAVVGEGQSCPDCR